MPFQVETATVPAAIGAGQAPPKFTDYTHLLRFENAMTGDTAEALATFGDGPELADAALWAERAHGLDLVKVEAFDAKAEAKRRKAEAEDSARDQGAAGDAAELVANARERAHELVDRAKEESAELVERAKVEAGELVERAKVEAGELVEAAKVEAADVIGKAEAKAAGVIEQAEQKAGAITSKAEAEAAGRGGSGRK